MDPTACLSLLQQHQRARADEIARGAPQAAEPNPTQQVIQLAPPPADADAPPPPPPAAATDAAEEPADVDVSALPAAELLARARRLQADRARTYAEFDKALDACAGDAAAYAAVVPGVTVAFDRISRRVNAIEAALRARGLTPAGDAIRKLQTREREKLELTAARHLGAFRPDNDANEAHLARRARENVAAINEALDELACELDGEE